MIARALLLLVLGGCAGPDADGDGAPRSEDCDDGDAARFPGAGEIACDGVDNDCDALTDDDDPDADIDATGERWGPDLDGDGFGRSAAAQAFCLPPEGWVTDTRDCDDARAEVNPDAAEVCDGVDGDCDGLGDDLDPDLVAATWYLDADDDGFGDATASVVACGPPSAYVATADDCDDTDVATFPGAPDPCGGGDADCDGWDDACAIEGEASLADATATLIGEGPGDGAGSALVVLDADGDAYADLLVAAPGGDTVYLARGPFAGARELYSADLHIHGVGLAATAAGDLDGDGLAEAIVGGGGGAWVFGGGRRGTGTFSTEDADGAYANAAVNTLAAGHDLDGDGLGDLVAGAPTSGVGDGANVGAVYLVAGPATGDLTASVALYGGAVEGRFGAAVASPGDLDGDGLADLVVGSGYDDDNGTNAGAAWVWFGPVNAARAADVTYAGVAAGDLAGAAVAGGGDVDNDGVADLLVGAPGEAALSGGAGAAYLVRGGGMTGGSLAAARCTLLGEDPGDGAGAALAGVGDVSGDGRVDVLVAGSASDRVWVLQAPFAGTISLVYAEGALLAAAEGDRPGAAVAGGGDLDGDGLWDLVVGSPGGDAGGSGAGVAAIVRGWAE